MEQKINVVLTADSQKATSAIDKGTEAVKNFSGAYDKAADSIKTASGTIADSSQSAMEKISDSARKQAEAIITASNKATSGVKKDTSLWGSFTDGAKKYFNDILSFQSFVGLGKKIASAWWKVTESMAGIGKSAKAIGASTEYFQQLKSTSEELGISFSSVEDAFKTVNEQASKARSGSQEAASAFDKIGISVRRLRQMSPDQVFQTVTSALYSMGDATYAQEAKFQLLGNSAGELTEHMAELSQAKGSMGGLFEDKDIKNAESLKESVDKLYNAINKFASLPIVTKSINWMANRLEESGEELAYRTSAKEMPKVEESWNDKMVPYEYKFQAAEYDIRLVRQDMRKFFDGLKEHDPELYKKTIENFMNGKSGFREPLFGYRDKDGLTPGQRKFKYDPVTMPYGFKNELETAPATKDDIENAHRKLLENQRSKKIAEMRALPFSEADEISSIIEEYDQALEKVISGEMESLNRNYEEEIRALSEKKRKEADAKEAIRMVDDAMKSDLAKQLEKDRNFLRDLDAKAGEDPVAKGRVADMRRSMAEKYESQGLPFLGSEEDVYTFIQRAAEDAGERIKLARAMREGLVTLSENEWDQGFISEMKQLADDLPRMEEQAKLDVDFARKTYENARRRLEMADKHVLAMQEAARAEREAARLAKRDATLSKASARLASFGFAPRKQGKMEKLDASIAAKLSARESGENAIFTTSELRRIKARRKAEKELESAEKALAREKKRQDKEAKAAKESEAIAEKQEQMASRNAYFQSAQAVSMATQRSHSLLERIAKASEKSVFVVKQK